MHGEIVCMLIRKTKKKTNLTYSLLPLTENEKPFFFT